MKVMALTVIYQPKKNWFLRDDFNIKRGCLKSKIFVNLNLFTHCPILFSKIRVREYLISGSQNG